jgi:hypothetical protein
MLALSHKDGCSVRQVDVSFEYNSIHYMKYTVIDLFAGAGGLTTGFHLAGLSDDMRY